MVTCPVSLGKEIRQEEIWKGKKLELPLLYAIYSKQAWLLSMMDSRSDVPKELLASVRKLVGDFRNEL